MDFRFGTWELHQRNYRLLRIRLVYHRRRMKAVARCRRNGEPLSASYTDLDGRKYRVTGWTRGSETTPDWAPILDCDISVNPVGGMTAINTTSKDYVEFDDVSVVVMNFPKSKKSKKPTLTFYWDH